MISPGDTAATFATHDSTYGKGGWREVANLTELAAVPTARLRAGAAAWVVSANDIYLYDGAAWNVLDTASMAALAASLASEASTRATDDMTLASAISAHLADTSDAHDASAISSIPAGTLASTDVQAALNELDTEKATTAAVAAVASDLAAHLADASDAHDASAISNVPAGSIASTDVQAALNELDTEKATTGSVSAVAADLAAHLADATAAHAASAIGNTPAGTIASTDVQAAINELDTEKATTGSVTTVANDLAAHLADATDAHDASAISYDPTASGMAATDVQAAIDELAAGGGGGGGGGTGDVVGPSSAVDSHFAQFDTTTGKLIKDGGLALDTDGTLAANSDTKLASQKAVKTYVDAEASARASADAGKQPLDATLTALAGLATGASKVPYSTGTDTFSQLTLDTDGTLAANSDTTLATQKAVKTYVDGIIAAQDAMVFKGVTDCSGNPNYPAANRGDTYRVSVAGKIGGASGVNVEIGDIFICLDDSTSAGTQAAQGAHWGIIQTNLDGAVIGPSSATDSNFAQFDGTSGKLIKGGLALDTDGTLAANSDTKLASQKAVKTYVDAEATARASADSTEASARAAADAGKQPLDATLTALAGVLTAANKIPYATATDTASELDLDTDGTLAANSDTKLASQKAVKTYVDAHSSSGLSQAQVLARVSFRG